MNYDYFCGMVKVARENPACLFLAFTKQYKIVNAYIANGNTIPDNLSVVFSAAPGHNMANPYDMPECHVRMAGIAETDQTFSGRDQDRVYECGGNCENCQHCGAGCWFSKRGDTIVINQH